MLQARTDRFCRAECVQALQRGFKELMELLILSTSIEVSRHETSVVPVGRLLLNWCTSAGSWPGSHPQPISSRAVRRAGHVLLVISADARQANHSLQQHVRLANRHELPGFCKLELFGMRADHG